MRGAGLRAATVAFLLAIFLLACLAADRADAPTYDETTHLAAGYLHLARGDYHFQVNHPPVAKMLAAMPLLWRGIDAPPAPRWDAELTNRFEHRRWAWRLLYGTPGQDAQRLVSAGRIPIMVAGLGLLTLVWAWTRRLHGGVAAAGALALAAVDPNLVAHAHLVTADVPVTAFMAGTMYALWRALARWRWGPIVLAGVLLGLGIATKYTAFLLVPIVALVAVGRALDLAPWPVAPWPARALRRRSSRLLAALSLIVIVMGLAGLTLWAAYRFRAAAAPDGPVELTARARAAWFPAVGSWPVEGVTWAARRGLIPDAWGHGLLYLWSDRRLVPQRAFLAGDLSEHGWWYYFPAALALKVPLGTWALAALGAGAATVAALRRRRGSVPAAGPGPVEGGVAAARRWGLVCLATGPIAVLGAGALSSLDIGLRQVLPVYPALLVTAGAGVGWSVTVARSRVARVAVGLLLLWVGASSWRVAPFYLAYFNEAAGGPAGGARWLVDSNLDWGQALRLLPAWLAARGITEINLCYFGTADPDAYGLDYVRLPGGTSYSQAPAPPRRPGHVAISATHLAGVHFSPALRAWYRDLLGRARLVGVVGYAIYVFEIPAGEAAAVPGAGASAYAISRSRISAARSMVAKSMLG